MADNNSTTTSLSEEFKVSITTPDTVSSDDKIVIEGTGTSAEEGMSIEMNAETGVPDKASH